MNFVKFRMSFFLVLIFSQSGLSQQLPPALSVALEPVLFPPIPIKMKGTKQSIFAVNLLKNIKTTMIQQEYLPVIELYEKKMAGNKDIEIELQGANEAIISQQKSLQDKEQLTVSPLLFGVSTTEAGLSFLNLLEQKKACALFPFEGSSIIRNKRLSNMIFFRPSHKKEVSALMDYAATILHRQEFAVLYEGSIWGNDLLKATQEQAKQRGLKILAAASYPEGTVSVNNAIDTLVKHSPNVVFCFASPRAAYNFIVQGINKGLYKSTFLGLSNVSLMQRLVTGYRGAHVVTASIVPDPEKSSLPIVEEFRKDMKSFLPYQLLSVFALEAYISMALFEQLLLSVKSMSIEQIIQNAYSWKNILFKGLSLNYDEKDHALSSQIWLNDSMRQEWYLDPGM